jgi:hypothetical protein
MNKGVTNFRIRTVSALTAVIVTMSLAAPAVAATVSISGGTRVSSIPQGNSGNSVLGQAGIGIAGGEIWVDGSLDNLSDVTLTLYDVGSESHWRNFIELSNTSGQKLRDRDDHTRRCTVCTNGSAPFQLAGSVTQESGLTSIEFSRLVGQEPELTTVVNGQSPMMNVPGYGYASIAFAYLSSTNQIVSGPTDRILILLEDGGADRDYDDYVGILVASSTSTATPEYTVSPTTALQFGNVAIHTISTAKTVTITNTGTVTLPIASINIKGKHPGQFAQTNDCPADVSVGSSCTVSVLFKPTWTGSKAAALWVEDGDGGSVRVLLRGTGI